MYAIQALSIRIITDSPTFTLAYAVTQMNLTSVDQKKGGKRNKYELK